jgi:hypothetical protein
MLDAQAVLAGCGCGQSTMQKVAVHAGKNRIDEDAVSRGFGDYAEAFTYSRSQLLLPAAAEGLVELNQGEKFVCLSLR